MSQYDQNSKTQLERKTLACKGRVLRWEPAQKQQSGLFMRYNPLRLFSPGSNPYPEPFYLVGTFGNSTPKHWGLHFPSASIIARSSLLKIW